jgi:PD-(D/E)XK nuclease superfamily
LLQTGYLTIKEITDRGTFILNYPNQEVKQSFAQLLLSEYAKTAVTTPHGAKIKQALEANNVEGAMTIIHNLIQAVPDHNYINDQEKFLHAIVHLIFTIIGTDVRSEVHSTIGQMDTVVFTKERIFIFEFKLNKSIQAALKQINDNNYAGSLRIYNLPITAIGVSLSTQVKGVKGWKAVEV